MAGDAVESISVFPVILRLPDLYMLRGKRWMASSWTCLGSCMMGTSSTLVSVNVLTSFSISGKEVLLTVDLWAVAVAYDLEGMTC